MTTSSRRHNAKGRSTGKLTPAAEKYLKLAISSSPYYYKLAFENLERNALLQSRQVMN